MKNNLMQTHVEHRSIPITNRTVVAQYYQERIDEAANRHRPPTLTPKQNAAFQRRLSLAADLRTMTQAAVMIKWKAGRALIDSIMGDMSIGLL